MELSQKMSRCNSGAIKILAICIYYKYIIFKNCTKNCSGAIQGQFGVNSGVSFGAFTIPAAAGKTNVMLQRLIVYRLAVRGALVGFVERNPKMQASEFDPNGAKDLNIVS